MIARWLPLVVVLSLTGCLGSTARQMVQTGPAESQPGALPPAQVAQQSGQGNLTAQVEAQGWTGFEYTTAVPVGQVVLMTLMLWLSHRREMLRLRQPSALSRRPC